MKLVTVLLTGVVMWMGCSSTAVMIQPDSIHEEQRVVLTLKDGTTVSGTALRANEKSLLLLDDSGEERIVFVKDIASAEGPEPIFDDNGRLISEMEIDSVKTNTNKHAYAIVGGLISLGMSYLAGTMADREFGAAGSDAAIYGGIAAGTVAGAVLFGRTGAQKDREVAIEYVLDSRIQAEEALSLPDSKADKILKQKIAETVALRKTVEEEIQQVLAEIEILDQQLGIQTTKAEQE